MRRKLLLETSPASQLLESIPGGWIYHGMESLQWDGVPLTAKRETHWKRWITRSGLGGWFVSTFLRSYSIPGSCPDYFER